jgi:hypothetical protein
MQRIIREGVGRYLFPGSQVQELLTSQCGFLVGTDLEYPCKNGGRDRLKEWGFAFGEVKYTTTDLRLPLLNVNPAVLA